MALLQQKFINFKTFLADNQTLSKSLYEQIKNCSLQELLLYLKHNLLEFHRKKHLREVLTDKYKEELTDINPEVLDKFFRYMEMFCDCLMQE